MAVAGGAGEPFPSVDKCDVASCLGGRSTGVSDLDGTLLRYRSAFPYYALVAFETGGVPRLALLLLLAPVASLLRRAAASESAAVRVLVFAATAGARMSDVESAARAVLPRFYAADVHPAAWRVFAACGGMLFASCHRTLLDAIFLSVALGRPVATITYSVSRLSELLSPIRTVRLTRDRATDAAKIRGLLDDGDLAICPEGTTCREPYLLRFSALFAELTDDIVPVATERRMSMFHGTTARGCKAMDRFYFFMNPFPEYTVMFLDNLPAKLTCGGGGKSSHDVANHVQKLIASTLFYECTSLTKRDKYRALPGNDGIVAVKTVKAK